MDNVRADLHVLIPVDPHRLERGEGGKNRTADPRQKLAVRGGADSDLNVPVRRLRRRLADLREEPLTEPGEPWERRDACGGCGGGRGRGRGSWKVC